MENRRTFLQQSAAAATLMAATGSAAAAGKSKSAPRKFKLRYAPHFGMFKEHAGPDDNYMLAALSLCHSRAPCGQNGSAARPF